MTTTDLPLLVLGHASDPGWLNRRTDDLLPDHGHLMHLYVNQLPARERVWQ